MKTSTFGATEGLYATELAATVELAAEVDILIEDNTSGRDLVIGRPSFSDDAVRLCIAF